MADVTMPQLGETVTEGTITKWFKQVGDQIKEDEVLFEVSTDKVDSEVPSPAAGYVAEILVQEGDTVDVGTKLAVISSEAPSGGGDGDGKAADAEAEEAPEAKEEAKEEPKEEPNPSNGTTAGDQRIAGAAQRWPTATRARELPRSGGAIRAPR